MARPASKERRRLRHVGLSIARVRIHSFDPEAALWRPGPPLTSNLGSNPPKPTEAVHVGNVATAARVAIRRSRDLPVDQGNPRAALLHVELVCARPRTRRPSETPHELVSSIRASVVQRRTLSGRDERRATCRSLFRDGFITGSLGGRRLVGDCAWLRDAFPSAPVKHRKRRQDEHQTNTMTPCQVHACLLSRLLGIALAIGRRWIPGAPELDLGRSSRTGSA